MKALSLIFFLTLGSWPAAKAEVISGSANSLVQYPNTIDLNEEHFKQTEVWKSVDLKIGWSSAGNPSKTGYLYAAESGTLIAEALGIEEPCKIKNAGNFSYKKFSLDALFVVGKVYLFHNPTTKFYAAFKVLSYKSDAAKGDQDQLSGEWYLQTDAGSDNFNCK